MAEPLKNPEKPAQESEEKKPSLGEEIRARIERPHKGDVGRPGTNEDVFQGSKERELL